MPTTLLTCIEYGWLIAVRCPACGHMVTWGPDDIAERFRNSLHATLDDVKAKVADHCGVRPVVYTLTDHAADSGEDDGRMSIREPEKLRALRLERFFAKHGLSDRS